MKSTIFVLALAALIAASYSAPLEAEATDKISEEPPKKVIFTYGKKGPDDKLMATLTAQNEPNSFVNFQTLGWRLTEATAHIAYITVSEVGPSTNATGSITDGGVGSDHLTFKVVPYNGGGMNFEVDIWGTYTEKVLA